MMHQTMLSNVIIVVLCTLPFLVVSQQVTSSQSSLSSPQLSPSPPSSSQNGVRPGTVVQLDTLDTVDVEASNKAIAEQEFESEVAAKKHAANVVRLAATDQLNSEIVTNKTRAYLSCESGEMIVKINFSEPFRGVGYSDYDRTSPCRFYGDGSKYYELRMPLKGCGTKQEAPRIFINNIILRFHRSLELEEDEIKTIICRYPPPLAPPPPLIAAPILEQPPENAPFMPAHLSQVELILIVSALLFLTLLLLGIGMGYYCLKRRNIKVVRKVPPPPFIPPIPRASLSSSETFYESDYDDMYRTNQHEMDEDYTVTRHGIIVPPILPLDSQYYDDRYMTNLSTTSIEEDVEVGRWIAPKAPVITTIITDEYYVTPHTTTEVIEDVTTHRLIVPPEKPLTIGQADDLYRTAQQETEVEEEMIQQRAMGPPVITTRTTDEMFITPQEDTEIIEEDTVHRIYNPKRPTTTMQTIDDYYRSPQDDTEVIEEIIDQRLYGPRGGPEVRTEEDNYHDVYEIDEFVDDYTTHRAYAPRGPTHTIKNVDDEFVSNVKEVEEFVDDTNRRVMAPKPKYTVKNIDDLYITNITESEVTEHIIKTGRSMPNLTAIPDDETDDDDSLPSVLPGPRTRTIIDEKQNDTVVTSSFDVTTLSGTQHHPQRRPTPSTTMTTLIDEKYTKETVRIEKILNTIDMSPIEKLPPQFDELFPAPKRQKLRTVILTDEVFRTLIVESTTIEEYTERVVHHSTYGPMFEPPTWEIIFRLFTLPDILDDTILPPTNRRFPGGSIRSYKSFKSGISGHEARSVTEEDVTYSRTMSSGHFLPPPDYDLDPSDTYTGPHWASRLPDPRRYELPPRDYSPVAPAFAPTAQSAFGPNYRLVNPYEESMSGSPLMRRRLSNFGLSRPYSPDLDALSLEPTNSRRNYTMAAASTSAAISSVSASSHRYQHQQQSSRAVDDQEEIKSTTETNVYDWKRYPRT